MFGVGPAYLFFLQYRLPVGLMRDGWQPWASTMATNLGIALIATALGCVIGIKAFLLVHFPIMLLAATAGVWLFYVQHQFEHTTWEQHGEWDLHEAALYGGSHYQLPCRMSCATIRSFMMLARLTLPESSRCVRLVLWDETQRRLVSFRDAPTSR